MFANNLKMEREVYFDQRGFARIDFKVAHGKQDVSVNVETENIA